VSDICRYQVLITESIPLRGRL